MTIIIRIRLELVKLLSFFSWILYNINIGNYMKKGLVLEGGAMRGLFTCGVLDVLMENGIEFDGIIGISAGATFGCNYKSKQIGRAVRYNKRFCQDKRYGSIVSFLKTGNLFDPDFCYHELPFELDIFDVKTFRENPMEFYMGVSDIKTGKPVYKKITEGTGVDLEWMRASASIPLLSKPVEIDGGLYLDGGITDSLPLQFFESIGYDKNVVVLTQPRGFVKKPNLGAKLSKIFLRKYPNFVKAFENRHIMYNNETKYIYDKADKGEIFIINPAAPLNINGAESNPEELQRVYDLGRKAAEEKVEALKEFLNKSN